MATNSQENYKKTFAMADSMIEKFWDMWLIGLGSISWSQEQVNNMMKTYMDRSKLAREESTKVTEELMNQVKNNQMQMQKMIQESVNAAMENINIPNMNYFEELNKKIEELYKKVETL